MPYQYLDDIATADIAFLAKGQTLEEVFFAAAEATVNVMAENPDSIRPVAARTVMLEDETLENLLFRFLQEFVYYKDAESLLLRPARVAIDVSGPQSRLEAELVGEEIDAGRHRMNVDVKAVTFHLFRLKSTDQGWEARVVLDI